MPDTNDASSNSVRGDYSISELRGMLKGEEPKPAAGGGSEKKETPAAEGARPDAKTAPNSGADETQASGTQERGADGKFKAKEGESGKSDTGESSTGESDTGKGEGEVPAGVQKRIDKAVRAQREAERRAEEAERKLRDNQGSRPGDGQSGKDNKADANNAQSADAGKPKPKPEAKDFETYDAYIEALSDWKYEQRRAAERREEETRSRQSAETELVRAHKARVEKAKEVLTDFDEVLADAKDLPISREMHTAIVTSEQGPELAYHLAKNPDEVKRIAALAPVRQIAELGKIEAALEAKAAAAKAEAGKPAEKKPAEKKPLPKPAANVGGGSGAAKEQKLDDPDIDIGTFKRLARTALKKAA